MSFSFADFTCSVREKVLYFFQISKKAFLNGYLTDISKKNVQQKFSVPYFEMSSQLRFGFTLIFKSLFFAICFIAMVIKLSMALNSL